MNRKNIASKKRKKRERRLEKNQKDIKDCLMGTKKRMKVPFS